MPLYEYRCETCGVAEEKLEGISAPAQHDCPQCGAVDGMRRQISVAAFSLSGSGWYAQGYSDQAKKPEPPKEASTAAPSGCCDGCPHKHGA